jgi:lactate dehydrogenase-like 2-hydroxyacid dehydrogenase
VGDYTFRIKIDASLCEKMKKVRLIQQPSTGYDHIDVEACAKRDIPVANIGGANAVSVAEHTVMLALILLKRAVYAHSKLVGGQWTQVLMNVIGEIYGKTMSINRDEDIPKAVEFVTEPGLKLLELRISPDDFPPMNIEAALRF